MPLHAARTIERSIVLNQSFALFTDATERTFRTSAPLAGIDEKFDRASRDEGADGKNRYVSRTPVPLLKAKCSGYFGIKSVNEAWSSPESSIPSASTTR